jgi:uncharacterized protein YecE (DUF72 family)
MAQPGRILVGTCNWADHKDFYPPGLPPGQRLRHYARFFPIVEADTTFYGIPKPSVTETWAAITPPTFLFNVKAYRGMTFHERVDGKARPPEPEEEADFADALKPLRDAGKLRAVHYQFPPWFMANARNMDYLSRLPDKHPQDMVVIEMRHSSWGEGARFGALAELLEESGMAYCVVDEPQLGSGSMPPHLEVTSDKLAVVRFHGRNKKTWYVKNAPSSDVRFDYLYGPEELLEWVPEVRRMADRAAEVHVLFNNNRSNYAVVNGLQMGRLLELGYPGPEDALALADRIEQPELPLKLPRRGSPRPPKS